MAYLDLSREVLVVASCGGGLGYAPANCRSHNSEPVFQLKNEGKSTAVIGLEDPTSDTI